MPSCLPPAPRAARPLAAGLLLAAALHTAAAPLPATVQDVSPLQDVSPVVAGTPVYSADVRHMQAWVLATGDNEGQPYAVVDKKGATLHVFGADGRLVGSSPALLGLASGDTGVPGIGERPLSRIRPHERTTPAGRFESQPGRHLSGDRVVWIDYAAALSIHRLRPAPAAQHRPQRLRSASAQDNRISLGCVIVASPFFDAVVLPTLGEGRGVVYVMPETVPVQAAYPLPAAGPRRAAALAP